MIINIKQIPEEGLGINTQEPSHIIDIGDERFNFGENIDIRVMAYHFNDRLYVIGSIKTKVGLQCSRCLKEYSQQVGNEQFTYDCEIEDTDVIDLTDRIREDIIVTLPFRPLCNDTCRGLCDVCGADLNCGNCKCKKKEKQVQGPFDVLKNIKL